MHFLGITLEGNGVGTDREVWRSKVAKWPCPLMCISRAEDGTWFAIVTFRSRGLQINLGGKRTKRAAFDALKKTVQAMQEELAVFQAG